MLQQRQKEQLVHGVGGVKQPQGASFGKEVDYVSQGPQHQKSSDLGDRIWDLLYHSLYFCILEFFILKKKKLRKQNLELSRSYKCRKQPHFKPEGGTWG